MEIQMCFENVVLGFMIMCDDIIFEDLHLAGMAGLGDITCDDLTHVYLSPDVWENEVFGLMI